jgi:hypothetical protein
MFVWRAVLRASQIASRKCRGFRFEIAIEEISAHRHAGGIKPHRNKSAERQHDHCSFALGQSLLFLDRGPRKRTQLIEKSAETLLDDGR